MNDPSDSIDLAEAFQRLFEIAPALDAASLAAVYGVRHEVYCRDLGWEPLRENGQESDDYDRHSLHCLLTKRDTGEAIGCIRVILTRADDPDYPLPMEDSCREVIDRAIADPTRMPRNTICEVSRLAVINTYRQRKGETAAPVSITDDDFAPRGGVQRFPYIPVSLYLSSIAIGNLFGMDNLLVLTEPRLASHFSRIGFHIHQIGGTIEHRGTRAPSLLSASKTVPGLRPAMQSLYRLIEAKLETAFRQHPSALLQLPPKNT
ncbi:PEP-CTERM/exosortase system-associated acyltransferase [Undibacterium sp.]|uniref:PEP-CTERM/exosortase system-associated acyltransferase n=1 Tax=Undibacterium sp. TaxID=1914977 RepID=UPI0025D474A1|nr:PEP-CTERM/exosortase system-associated acyltransferase [Undibacterium sp.]